MAIVIIILIVLLIVCCKMLGTLLDLIGQILGALFDGCGCLTLIVIGIVLTLFVLI